MLKFTLFCNFQRVLGKSAFLNIAVQTFEAGDSLNIFLRFWGVFEVRFLTKSALVKKCILHVKY